MIFLILHKKDQYVYFLHCYEPLVSWIYFQETWKYIYIIYPFSAEMAVETYSDAKQVPFYAA